MTKITRRAALFSGLSVASASVTACSGDSRESSTDANNAGQFVHGLASGDPGATRMVIWSRVTPQENLPLQTSITAKWEVALDPAFRKIKRKGTLNTDARRDYTLKVDVHRLKPAQTYYYRFKVGDTISPTGRTRTLPKDQVEKARLAVVSCSNYPFGFFNVYDHIAKTLDFDAVIHLGDYFYEYGRDGYGGKVGKQIDREHSPAHEAITLADYRTRHAQYKSDQSAQAMHGTHPMICIWDDHETANDSWKGGAENHNANEGSWDARRAAAMQAYYEWMPVRDPVPGRAKEALFNTYKFGNLFSLCALETRLTARSRQIDYGQYIPDLQTRAGIGNFIKNVLGDPSRKLLGAAQSAHVTNALKTSKTEGQPWRLLANQVIMARTASPNLSAYKGKPFLREIEKIFPQIHDYIALSPLGLPMNLDAWDGYPAAREQFYDQVQTAGVTDLLVLTGDTHECWANKLVRASGQPMGIELATTSVTSPGSSSYFGENALDFSAKIVAKNDDVVYHDINNHGYIDLTLTQDKARAIFISVDTVTSLTYKSFESKVFTISKTASTLALTPET